VRHGGDTGVGCSGEIFNIFESTADFRSASVVWSVAKFYF